MMDTSAGLRDSLRGLSGKWKSASMELSSRKLSSTTKKVLDKPNGT